MNIKICKDCLLDQPIANFTIVRANKDGYNNRCKPCDNAHQMANINGRLEAYKAGRLAYRTANKEKYAEYRRHARAKKRDNEPGFYITQWEARRARDPKTFWAKAIMAQIRVRHKRKNLPCDVDYEYLLSIAPDVCPVFGTPFVFTGGRGGFQPDSASVDRIEPDKGYVRGNLVVVSWRANMIKRDATVKELKTVAHFYHNLTHGLL